jgi:hypothetical protein
MPFNPDNTTAFPKKTRGLLQGSVWGEVYPPLANPQTLTLDGRTAALHILREYVCDLTFYRYMGKGSPPKPFGIKPENFYIEWPDSTVDKVSPSITIVHSRADYDVIGLVSYIEEQTLNVYSPGTVVQWQDEYVETINLEIETSKVSERRSLLGGLETAFSPVEQMAGVRFKMPEYFNQLVCFTLMRREVMDDADSAKNRRKAQLEILMRFNIVKLVNVKGLGVNATVNTDYDQFGNPVNLTYNAQLGPDQQSIQNYNNSGANPANPFPSTPNPVFAPPLPNSYTGKRRP